MLFSIKLSSHHFQSLYSSQSYIGMIIVLLDTSVISVGLVQILSYLPGYERRFNAMQNNCIQATASEI